MREDFFSMYLNYTKDTEVPVFFHRWSAIASVGAFLGRDYNLPFGHSHINPNIYAMLIGSPGTRKSTAIKSMQQLIKKAGYEHIAADKTTKEKFLLDLSGEEGEESAQSVLDKNLWGAGDESSPPAECFIMADEFNDFLGHGNLEFISLLGNLWDYNGVYKNKVKNSQSVSIVNPTISILGGNTPTGFSLAFPPEILGQGFFSRILLIYGEPSGRKITFPTPPNPEDTALLVNTLHQIKTLCRGEAQMTPKAKLLLEKIYTTWKGIDDVRFDSYSNRRFTHLLKLCLIHSASTLSTTITESDVISANTVLHFTESLMPRALGEFGKAKHSDVSHKIITFLESWPRPATLKEIWKHVAHNQLEKMNDLAELLRNLLQADKIQSAGQGFLPKKKILDTTDSDILDFSYLTPEEKGLMK